MNNQFTASAAVAIIPKGLRKSAQGCEERATLGYDSVIPSTLKGLRNSALITYWLFTVSSVLPATVTNAPVPKSPYLPIIYRYADAMLEKGRDTNGVFLSALNREPIRPLTNRPPAPFGVHKFDRVGTNDGPLVGSNPHHDQNLLRLLYTLSELSGKPKYRDAADGILKWFFANRGKMSWHDSFRPWLLWDRCFELAAERRHDFQISFRADAYFSPRHAGFYVRTWASGYSAIHEPNFLVLIEGFPQLMEKRRNPAPGSLEAATVDKYASVASSLSLAIDCDGAAHRVPEKLASRLRQFAAIEDDIFCALPHNLRSTRGFITEVERPKPGADGFASTRPIPSPARPTQLWKTSQGTKTTAQIGMMCVSRYENTGQVRYRELIDDAADAYLKTLPEEDCWPMTLGHAISLQLAAWRSSARQVYLDRAREFGDFALTKFFDKGALPRASLKTDHYESITGADTLALALTELHLSILHITAVRCPANTIDR